MKAAVTPAYGSADVLETRELPTPIIGDHDVLIQVRATPVTEGDRRLRSADFPSISALPGRLMIGVRRPKHAVQGTMFAGRVVAVGRAVTRYAVGDDVFGSTDHGAYAEYLAMPEDGSMAKMPSTLGHDEAAAVPYGAVTALRFLRDLGGVKPGDHVLILGASGGVGRFAVQLAKHLGAEVTGVCSREGFDLVRSLGADHLIDYQTESYSDNGRLYDVIFDIADATTFACARSSLKADGRYLTLFVSVGILLQMALTSVGGGQKAKFGIAMGTRDDLEELARLVERGIIRPVVARRFAFERIADAHVAAETGSVHGSVVVTLG